MGHHISLMHGWVPAIVQAITVTILLLAIGWRSARWRTWWLPTAILVGVAAGVWARWFISSQGLAGDPAPRSLSIWVGLTGLAVGVLILGWRGGRWWRRGLSTAAVPLCLLCAALALNQWVGYFPTVQTAWNQLTAGPLPDEVDLAAVTTMQQEGTIPSRGTVVQVDIGDAASHFRHRGELVYLPPAWYRTVPPPRLPAVMMIAGEFNTPADWLRVGNAITAIDTFANAHGGNAPVFVFVDPGGTFNNDTECVNGSRGNAADHLTKDVIPYVVSHFGVSPGRSNWGVVGWSMGGTCAVDLAVMHPELFSAFEDIAGDLGPNSGTKAQTISRLFGGNAGEWAAFDPSTVITRHGRYTAVGGWFAINRGPGKQTDAANRLCRLGSAHGISCAVVAQTGRHDWPFAARAFAAALPWMAGQIGSPAATRLPFPSKPKTPPSSSSRQLRATGR